MWDFSFSVFGHEIVTRNFVGDREVVFFWVGFGFLKICFVACKLEKGTTVIVECDDT